MEKITVEIGLKKSGPGGDPITHRGSNGDAHWLMNTLGISFKRARKLVDLMVDTNRSVPMVLDHTQLARYVALRSMQAAADGVYRWAWPKVTDYQDDEFCPSDCPIELRPGRRITPDRC